MEHNYKVIRSRLSNNTKLCCVVKANGYGHGAVQLSKLYENLGAGYLAVSNIEEAIQLRNGDINLPILILGYTDPQCASDLSNYHISQCVFSYEYGKSLARYRENGSEELIDIRDVHVSRDLPREKRIEEYVRQIRNPYHFRCGEITVHVSFTPNGPTLEECIAGIMR